MADQAELARRFLALHQQDSPLLLANAWDEGSAKMLRRAGFSALATTSSGFAATLGRADYRVTREESVAHAGAVAAASGLPVSADFENCFADDAEGIAQTVRAGREAGLAGCSIEDSGTPSAESSTTSTPPPSAWPRRRAPRTRGPCGSC